MKIIRTFIKSNFCVFVGIVIGLILSTTIAYAAIIVINGEQVTYDNTNTSLSSTNIQDALNELYSSALSEDYLLNKYKTLSGTPTNYLFSGKNLPTTESPTSPPNDKHVYLGLYSDGQLGVCIERNSAQHCFRSKNFIAEVMHVKNVFSDIKCNFYSFDYTEYCLASDFSCIVRANGGIYCRYHSDIDEDCVIQADGSVNCF